MSLFDERVFVQLGLLVQDHLGGTLYKEDARRQVDFEGVNGLVDLHPEELRIAKKVELHELIDYVSAKVANLLAQLALPSLAILTFTDCLAFKDSFLSLVFIDEISHFLDSHHFF
jgi:hypothetical protein